LFLAHSILDTILAFDFFNPQDLKKAGWVARRELFTAKKIEEVRAQAEAELGLISSTITGGCMLATPQ
jgi:hypothetical protein